MIVLHEGLIILAQKHEKYSAQEIFSTIEYANKVQRQYDDLCFNAPESLPDEVYSEVEIFQLGSPSRQGSCEMFPVRKWQKQIKQYNKAIAKLQSAIALSQKKGQPS